MKLLGSRSSLVRQRRKRKPSKQSLNDERTSQTNSSNSKEQIEMKQSNLSGLPNLDMQQPIVMQPPNFLTVDIERRGGQQDQLYWGKVDDYDYLNRDIFNPVTTTTFHDDQLLLHGTGNNYSGYNYNNNYAFTCSSASDWQDPCGICVLNEQTFGEQRLGGFQEGSNETAFYTNGIVANVLEEFFCPQNGVSTATTTTTTEDVCFLGDLVQKQNQLTNEFQLNSLKFENDLQFINQQLNS
eukprot:TRINITY_DN17329_c0_g1_i1.p3 TRINITY_DN17329_c0_g1~~TRINITY_DN17329_c0_g1_i1.p3  ORF type:complete len:240 (-),score=24.04 TRINITY_DN17329_c0_g1_i1:314-1033(-)